ncbi:MAG: twin-arginine translocase TatA/TatE family subunit [Actinomycetota bacterium]|nr:twin-arginine translocase TatA/TatE family subunit [Actinomycetota bacterium]
MGDLLIIILIAVLVFGKGRAAQAKRDLGDTVRSFKKGLYPDEINITPGRKEVEKR